MARPLLVSSGIAHVAQPEASLAALRGVVAAMDAFKLTALHAMTSLTGSALIALAHAEGELPGAAAWAAANTDERWQASHWGEDFEAAERLKARLAEFEAASRFFQLLKLLAFFRSERAETRHTGYFCLSGMRRNSEAARNLGWWWQYKARNSSIKCGNTWKHEIAGAQKYAAKACAY